MNEKSVYERMPDKAFLKYLRYVWDIISPEFPNWHLTDADDFVYFLKGGTIIEKKIAAPIGGNLSRLDVEYLFYGLKKSNLESGDVVRPTLEDTNIDYVTEEKELRRYTRSGSIETYLGDTLTNGYLQNLKEEGVIDPWYWEITDEDTFDAELRDDWFDV
jgi:hypothetical protein